MKPVAVLLLAFAVPCSAQMCIPSFHPEPNDAYTYVRAEIAALGWIQIAMLESEKIQPPTSTDPEGMHKAVEMYTIANSVSDDYDCAASILKDYKGSKNDYIQQSVDSLLEAIKNTKTMNAHLLEMMEALYKATKPEEIDQLAIARDLGTMKSAQKDVHNLTMMAVKISTFAIVKLEGEGDNARPVALSITKSQRDTLVADARTLFKDKSQTYIDVCAEIIITTLNLPLPTAIR